MTNAFVILLIVIMYLIWLNVLQMGSLELGSLTLLFGCGLYISWVILLSAS